MIEVVTDEQAEEIMAREAAYDSLLASCSGSLVPTSYLKQDDLANRPFESVYILRVAKLMEPIELTVAGRHRLITQVSDVVDLIYGVGRDSIDCLSYLEVTRSHLAAFVGGAIEAGLQSDIEKALKQQRKTFSSKLRSGTALEI